jgi:hypothetical protein
VYLSIAGKARQEISLDPQGVLMLDMYILAAVEGNTQSGKGAQVAATIGDSIPRQAVITTNKTITNI